MRINTIGMVSGICSVAALAILMPPALADGKLSLAEGHDHGQISAKARGSYEIAGTTADIELKAKQKLGREARGRFRHTLVFQGLLIDFVGQITCMAVDSAHGRAWLGGIVTENNSDHPDFVGARNEPGKDIWFRVLDDDAVGDRTTFVGFEGDGGIITSEEYCQEKIWPGPPDDAPNARTNPMSDGAIKVRPNSAS